MLKWNLLELVRLKKIIFGIVVCSVLLFASFISLGLWLVLFAADLGSVEYYSDDNNYERFECSVDSYVVYDDMIAIDFVHLKNNYYESFSISGKNYNLALQNGLLDILQKDVIFKISSADAYLGDGWRYPIVELIYNGDEIIPYAQGKQNFVDYQQQAENCSKNYLMVAGGIFIFLIVIEICLIIVYLKKKKFVTSGDVMEDFHKS